MINHERLIKQLILHEGNSPYAYEDSLGYLSVGIGRCIDKRIKKGLSEEEQLYLVRNDIKECLQWLSKYQWFNELDEIRKEFFIELGFNLGESRLLTFKKMIAAVEKKDFITASKELINSKWASQVKDRRASNLKYMILLGEYPD